MATRAVPMAKHLDMEALYQRQLAQIAQDREGMTYEEMLAADDFDGSKAEQQALDDMPASEWNHDDEGEE